MRPINSSSFCVNQIRIYAWSGPSGGYASMGLRRWLSTSRTIRRPAAMKRTGWSLFSGQMDCSGTFSESRRNSTSEVTDPYLNALWRACGCSIKMGVTTISIQIMYPFLHVGIDGVIRLGEVTRVEQRLAHMLGIVAADGIGKNRQQVLISQSRRLHQLGIVQSRMHTAWMDQTPAI